MNRLLLYNLRIEIEMPGFNRSKDRKETQNLKVGHMIQTIPIFRGCLLFFG